MYCHGNPTHGEDWVPFMERGGPSIAIDMPGWGRSDKPDPARFAGTGWRRFWRRRPLGELVNATPIPTASPSPARTSAASPVPPWSSGAERDPYLPTKFARDYASVLPDAELDIVQGAGHWPWIDDPSVVDRVHTFLG